MSPGTTDTAELGWFGLYESWLKAVDVGVGECIEYTRLALERGPRPFDYTRWLKVAGDRRPPRWASEHTIVQEWPLARMRDFSPPGATGVVPTLVLPPQAGHDSCIVDYSAEQSQMRAIIRSGLTRAFTLDWVGATRATSGATIEDYMTILEEAVEQLGGRVNLIGDCQGGWLATIYAALYPKHVNTLTIAGAPVDFHAGEPIIHEVVRAFAPGGNLAFYEALVRSAGGVLKGEHLVNGFIGINPSDEVGRQLALLRNLDDAAHVARYAEFEDWFKHTQDIPGDFYLWIVRRLFRDNALIDGTLEVRGRRVALGDIKMPLNLLAGGEDHITPAPQVWALADHAATPVAKVRRQLTRGGHLGLFMGHEALEQHWPPILAAILQHS